MKTKNLIGIILTVRLTAAVPALAQVPDIAVQAGALQGYSVAVDGNVAVVGAVLDDAGAPDSGAAKVYDATTGALRHTRFTAVGYGTTRDTMRRAFDAITDNLDRNRSEQSFWSLTKAWMTLAMVNVLPEPVTPISTWLRLPLVSPSKSASMACG